MNEERMELHEQEQQEIVEEKAPFEPSPRWKRVLAWIMVAIVSLGVINWLISIAYPQWPEYIMGLFR